MNYSVPPPPPPSEMDFATDRVNKSHDLKSETTNRHFYPEDHQGWQHGNQGEKTGTGEDSN